MHLTHRALWVLVGIECIGSAYAVSYTHLKFYLLDELDEAFVKECVDVETYKEYQGRWVKNAYDPQFTVDGKYDEKAAAAAESLDIYSCMMMKAANKAFKIEKHVHNYPHCWRNDKPVLYYPLDLSLIHI